MNKTRLFFIISAAVSAVLGIVLIAKGKKSNNMSMLTRAKSSSNLPLKQWKNALMEAKNAVTDRNLGMLSTSLAYYGTLAFFPTLVAFIAIYSLVVSPEQLTNTITAAERYLPEDIANVVSSQLQTLKEQQGASIIAATIAVAVALFSASGGMQNMVKALNIAYKVEDTRNFIKVRLLSIGLMLAGVIILFPIIVLLAMNQSTLSFLGADQLVVMILPFVRWILVAIIVALTLAALYRYGPNRKNPKFQFISWGASIATIVWLAGTWLFTFYLQKITNLQESYGVFAGIIALMLWFNLSSFIILLGAIINYRLEKKLRMPFVKN